MNGVVQHFYGTTEEWERENPILYKGVWGFERAKNGYVNAKIGDGKNRWNNIDYFDKPKELSELIDKIENTIKRDEMGIPGGVATLDEKTKKVPLAQLPDAVFAEIGSDALKELLLTILHLQTDNRKLHDEIINSREFKNTKFPLGYVVPQYINTKSPVEMEISGRWEICNSRAARYKLRPTALPAYTVYTQGANFAAGAYVMNHLNGDDWNIYQAKEALTNVPAQLDPIKWTEVAHPDEEIIDQRFLHAYTDDDFIIGSQIEDGEYEGWYVAAIYVYGGKYMAASGGNRPPFISGTVGDAIRNIGGNISGVQDPIDPNTVQTLPFVVQHGAIRGIQPAYTDLIYLYSINFSANRVVPGAKENQVRTMPILYWRLISLQ